MVQQRFRCRHFLRHARYGNVLMSAPISSTTRLDAALRDAGCTFDGLAIYPPTGNPPAGGTLLVAPAGEQVRITPVLPPAQVPTAQQVVDGFIFGEAKVRRLADIYRDIT